MPESLVRALLGDLVGDAVRLVAAVLLAIALCTVALVQAVPMALLSGGTLPGQPGWTGQPGTPDMPPEPPPALAVIVAEVEGRTGIPASLLTALAFVESGFDPRAVGPLIPRLAGTEDAHALGLMQFLPSTYRGLAPRVDTLTGVTLGEAGLWHPRHAVYGSALYLRDHGAPADLRQALFAYNQDDTYVTRVLVLAARYAQRQPASTAAARALALARTQLGVPYRWGGTGDGGFDCSGLTQWAYAAAGVSLPRTAEAQYHATQRLRRNELRPGDLLFFDHPDPDQPGVRITHVSLFVGDNQMLNAPAPSAVVRIEPIWSSFTGGGRVRP